MLLKMMQCKSTRLAAKIFVVAGILSVFASALSVFLNNTNSFLFFDILKGLNMPGLDACTASKSAAGPAILNMTLLIQTSLLCTFAVPAVWSGYKLSGAGKLVVSFQIFILGMIAEVAVWKYLNVSGMPLTLALLIAGALFVGRLVRKNHDERVLFDSKTIELELRNRELTESRLAMVKQDESERRLLAADLHDQVLNDLRIVFQKFENYATLPTIEGRDEISVLMKQSMTDVREIMDDLCPTMLSEFGLPAAVEDRLDKAADAAGFSVRFTNTVKAEVIDLLSVVEQQLIYRLVQESITNVRKHAEATILRVDMSIEEDQMVIRVVDNGKGINPFKASESSRGLVYMRLRAALIGAKIFWQTAPGGSGTTVEIRINVSNALPAPSSDAQKVMPGQIPSVGAVVYV